MSTALVKCFTYAGRHAHISCHATGAATAILIIFSIMVAIVAFSVAAKL